MKQIKLLFLFLSAAILLVGCGRAKELAYFHDAARDSAQPIGQSYQCVVHKGDLLHIYVSAEDAESVIPFNQETNRAVATSDLMANATSASELSASAVGYLVDNQGDILFPVVGRMHVEGLTLEGVSRLVELNLMMRDLVNQPVVTTRLLNFRVAVLGEVNQPAWVQVEGARLTILEALAMAGDMTIYGLRDKVHVIRDNNGVVTTGTLDLTSQELFDSPYYYLQQNDVVFVEPNDKRKREYRRNDQIMNYIYLGVSISTLTSTTVRTISQIMRYY